MAARTYPGATEKTLTVDAEGHREYKVKFLVMTTDHLDGPTVVLDAPGLPLPGTPWILDNDVDPWAYRRQNASVSPHQGKQGEANHWDIEFTFSTKPPDDKKQRCNDQKIEDPLLEPPKISGSFSKYTEEATKDRFGNPVVNSAWEQMRGANVEFDASRPTVKVEQNVASLGLELFAPMIDTVNIAPLWGLARRKIKLSNVSWERKYHGLCYKYYTRTLEFEIRYDGWDRDILDEGTKVLNGEWDAASGLWTLLPIAGAFPDQNNPQHFIRYKDRNGENSRAILDGAGKPFTPSSNAQVTSCGQCTGGAPKYFRIQGFRDSNDEIVIENFGSCGWSGTFDAGDNTVALDLDYIPGEQKWLLNYLLNGTFTASYITNRVDWGCFGPNAMYIQEPIGGGAGLTDMVTLVAGSEPGNIHIEKYRESNFLLLGIPVVL